MNVTDPIADLLTRIRNAQKAQKEVLSVPASKMKIAIVHLLKQEGLVKAYKCVRDDKQELIKIALKYHPVTKAPAIHNISRISKPGLRKYAGMSKMPRVLNGLGIAILSTSKGVMTNKEAKVQKIGGEVLCYVY